MTTDQDLSRFIIAQEKVYQRVLKELKNGRKTSHWMWYIFPQIDGLAFSSTSAYYSIKSIKETNDYLKHNVLGTRLKECATIVYNHDGKSIESIFGYPDYLKFKSSMTLFSHIKGDPAIFSQLLQKYFEGEEDEKTIAILNRLGNN